MRIGIMQPYFFPYIGYFQLIDTVDIYVNLDHVSFMKRSYMTRNSIKNNTSINIPVSGGSQNKTCKEVTVLADDKWWNTFEKTLVESYKKESQCQLVLDEILLPWKNNICTIDRPISISEFNFSAIYFICKYLDINTRFYSSDGITTRKKNEGLQDITKYFNGTTYINAIGGQALYNKEDFASQNIDLYFLKMGDVEFENPYSSILDLLFTYPKEHIQQQLKKYTLI
jgi:hypothetical protein